MLYIIYIYFYHSTEQTAAIIRTTITDLNSSNSNGHKKDDDESKISFRDVAWRRTQKACNVLKQRWEQLKYKGQQFTMQDPATTSDIEEMFEVLKRVFPSKPWEKKLW